MDSAIKCWSEVATISIPKWITENQAAFQSLHYPDDTARMSFVLDVAKRNAVLTNGVPLAAAVFTSGGKLISVGVDAEGIGGHEMTNALIIASNILGSSNLRKSTDWELFSLAPPCLICLGNTTAKSPDALYVPLTIKNYFPPSIYPTPPCPTNLGPPN